MCTKKDGTHRLTLDYRKLNALTAKDETPIPLLQEVLDMLGQAKYFASADATKGFLQSQCSPESAPLAAFTTGQLGLYQPTVLMMGLKNGPPTFQRCMNIGLAKHIGVRCFVYLDDLVIFNETTD